MRYAIILIALLAACGGSGEEAQPTETPAATATPSPAPTATPTPTPIPWQARELAYEDEDRGVWLINADGSDRRLLTYECPAVGLYWSPTGEMLACSYFSIVVFNLEGQALWRTDDTPLSPIAWSPDGERLAYQASDQSLHIVHPASQTDSILSPKALPLAWPQPDRLLAGLNPVQGQLFLTWEAHLIDPDTGSAKRMPRLDNVSPWFLPGGDRAILVGEDGLMTFDIRTGEEKLIARVRPVFPGEGLPFYAITVSDDGRHVYTADASSRPTVIYRIDTESGAVEEQGTVPGVLLSMSPEGIVAYLAYGGLPETLYLANLDTGNTVEVGGAYNHMAWRPTP